MNVKEVKAIFDKALTMKIGESLKLTIEDRPHAVSFRTMFYRERKKFLDQGGNTGVVVSKILEFPDKAIVVVTNNPPTEIMLVDEHGKETALTLSFGTEPIYKDTTIEIDPGKEKMIKTMIEDNLSKEEILGYFEDLNDGEKALIETLFEG